MLGCIHGPPGLHVARGLQVGHPSFRPLYIKIIVYFYIASLTQNYFCYLNIIYVVFSCSWLITIAVYISRYLHLSIFIYIEREKERERESSIE